MHSCSDLVFYQQVSISWLEVAAFFQWEEIQTNIRRKKNCPWGVSQFEIVECCHAKLTPSGKVLLFSQILSNTRCHGSWERERASGVLAEKQRKAGLGEILLGRQGAGREGSTWCWQWDFASLFVPALQAMLMLKCNK